MVGGWRGGREEFCCGVFYCLVGLPWAVLTLKQELSVVIFFFLPSWLSLWSNCPVLFCYWPLGPDWSRERWRRKGGQRLPSEGLPNPPKALLERLPRPPKELERLKGSAKCQTGISKKGGLASSAHPNTNPFHSAFLLQASCGCFSAATLALYPVNVQ